MHPGMSTAHAPAPGVAPSAAPALVVPPWRTDPLPGTLPPTMALEGLATQASTGAAPLLIPVSTHPAAQAAPAPVLQAFPLQSHTAPAPAVQTAPVPALYTAPSPALQMVTPQAPPRQAAVPPAAPAPPAPPVVVPHAQATAAAPQAPMLVPTELPVPQPAARRPSLRRGEAEQLQTVLDCLTGPRAAAAPAAQAGAPAVASGQARAVAPAAAAPVPPTAVKEESSQASASQAPVMLPDGWSAKYSGRKQQYYYFRVDQSGRPYERGHDNKTKTYWLHEFQAALAESGPGWPLDISEPPPAAPASSSAARPADVPVLTLESSRSSSCTWQPAAGS
ncbi:unnamed protein product [Prorocentrum cordatum]|uniref:WW domain-containing protein n=1 Tax=Prorocentrum cordatum TaxID=2364126 RepID=A0ABN9TYF0_9DINO|nr:unnamed protein product [Polarella glacialis]